MGGSLGKAASQAANFMMSIQQMGAIGGIMAGGQMAITAIANHFKESADAMLESVNKMATKIRDRLDEMNKNRMDGLNKSLEEATTKAREAAAAFDAMASSYLKVQSAKNETEAKREGTASSALSLEKAREMSATNDDTARALVGAEYDVKIARANAANVKNEHDRAVDMANKNSAVKSRQAKMAAEAEQAALVALNEAEFIHDEDVYSGNDKNEKKSKSAVKEAKKAYEDALNDRARKEAEATAADEAVTQAQYSRATAINDATRAIVEAESTEKQLIEAKKKAAQEELKRISEEKKAHELQMKQKTKEENVAILSGFRNNSASQFQQAFDLWRDPEAAAAAVESDKKRSADLKAFNKAVNHYGGKYKIDEYAALMRAGDEEGMQSRLDQWRKSAKFTPQVEQMVKAEAARQNENAADRALANIEKNTANLDKKIDQLLSVK